MADQTATAPPVLVLDTLLARPTVTIDGKPYEMYAPDELSVLENRRIILWGNQAEVLEAVGDPTDEQLQEYDVLIKKIADALLLAPADVKARLSKQQRARVGVAFLQLWLEMQKKADHARADDEAEREDGESQGTTAPTEPLATTGAS